jgi:hypothetical protein
MNRLFVVGFAHRVIHDERSSDHNRSTKNLTSVTLNRLSRKQVVCDESPMECQLFTMKLLYIPIDTIKILPIGCQARQFIARVLSSQAVVSLATSINQVAHEKIGWTCAAITGAIAPSLPKRGSGLSGHRRFIVERSHSGPTVAGSRAGHLPNRSENAQL